MKKDHWSVDFEFLKYMLSPLNPLFMLRGNKRAHWAEVVILLTLGTICSFAAWMTLPILLPFSIVLATRSPDIDQNETNVGKGHRW